MDESLINRMIEFIRQLYPGETVIPLHAPRFLGNEKKYLTECIDSSFVSYLGRYVADFEAKIASLCSVPFAVAFVNGTAALHVALTASGVRPGDLVVTQAFTFVATANAIRHALAEPAFIDVERDTLGMSPESLREFLTRHCRRTAAGVTHIVSGRRVGAIVPMHSFGHPARIEQIRDVCGQFGVLLIEDAAESLGSYARGRHTGTFGDAGIFSFNGNKPVTTGGGGMLVTSDAKIAERARRLSTTAKRPHAWEYFHDEVAFNLRMPNVNAAIGCAQMEYFDDTLADKRETARQYAAFFRGTDLIFVPEPEGTHANYWLNSVICPDRGMRDLLLSTTNARGVQTRPAWALMPDLPMYMESPRTELPVARWLQDRLVNLPSGVRKKAS